MESAASVEGDTKKRVKAIPEVPELSERVSVSKAPTRPRPKASTVKVAAVTPKLAAVKRHPFLRPSEQKPEKAGKTRKTGKKQHRYAKARKAHQQQGRR